MGECANFCENRLLGYRKAVNASLGTRVSFPPFQSDRMRKPEGFVR
jgi:hypothetical protein